MQAIQGDTAGDGKGDVLPPIVSYCDGMAFRRPDRVFHLLGNRLRLESGREMTKLKPSKFDEQLYLLKSRARNSLSVMPHRLAASVELIARATKPITLPFLRIGAQII